jgi:hypothetical protein
MDPRLRYRLLEADLEARLRAEMEPCCGPDYAPIPADWQEPASAASLSAAVGRVVARARTRVLGRKPAIGEPQVGRRPA